MTYPFQAFIFLSCIPFSSGWLWLSSSQPNTNIPPHTTSSPHRSSQTAFEIQSSSQFSSHKPIIKETQQVALQKEGDGTLHNACWHNTYRELFSRCREIIQNEEMKARLAYDLTDCFLRMTGWPSLGHCPKNKLAKSCTESLDEHTHEIYLAFFVDTVSMCHYLQSEVFQRETENAVNNLKESAYWTIDMLKDMEIQSEDFSTQLTKQSGNVDEKFKKLESQSQSMIQHAEKMEGKLKGIKGLSNAATQQNRQIIDVQNKFREKEASMHKAVLEGMVGLQAAAKQTHEQIQSVGEVQKQISEQQLQIADNMQAHIEKIQENTAEISSSITTLLNSQEHLLEGQDKLLVGQRKAIETSSNLQKLQASAMEQTRLSLLDLSEHSRKHQLDMKVWQLENDQLHQRLSTSSEAMLKIQETFLDKQTAIFTTLDRLFYLYNTILLESRALKTLLFYGVCIIFVHLLTSIRQANNARVLLYAGLCLAMGVELWLIKFYGKVMANQTLVKSQTYWTRSTFGAFVVSVFAYCLFTYRDITGQNNKLLLDLHKLANQLDYFAPSEKELPRGLKDNLRDEFGSSKLGISRAPFHERKHQTVAQKILDRAHNYIMQKKRAERKRRKKQERDNALSNWMQLKGMDPTILERESISSDEEIYNPSLDEGEEKAIRNTYALRSRCGRGIFSNCTLRHGDAHPPHSLS